ncbi:MAG: hypothetical protein ACODAA_06665 [Gemmatimonadota bacterium]
MAKLQAVIGSLDDLDESLHDFYEKGDDGKFYLNVHGVDAMPAVRGLKQNKQELLAEKKELQEKLDALDVTPEELTKLRERAEAAGDEDVEKVREEYERKLEAVRTQAKKEVEGAKSEAEKAVQAARNYAIDAEIGRALNEAEGEPALLSHIMREKMDARIREGDRLAFDVVVLGEDGEPKIKDSNANPFTAVDLATELKGNPKYQGAFKSSGTTGSGSDPTNRGGGDTGGATKSFDRSDPRAWGEHAEGVAKGEAVAK